MAMDEVSGPVIAVGLVLSGGVRALRVHQRDHRAVLPPVRPDDRRLDDHLGLQLAHAQPGPGGHAAAVLRERETHEPLPRLGLAGLAGWGGYLLAGELPIGWLAVFRPANVMEWLVPALLVAGDRGGRLSRLVGKPFRQSRPVLGLRPLPPRPAPLHRGLYRHHPEPPGPQGPGAGVYAGLLVVTWLGFRMMPMGFIPSQDMGYLLVNLVLPDSASLEPHHGRYPPRGEDHYGESGRHEYAGVKHTVGVVGMSLRGAGVESGVDVPDP